MLSTFQDIRNTVEDGYPQPIAQAFRRYRVAPPTDLGGRHKMLIDLFELFAKFLCIVELQEGLQFVRNFRDRLPQKDKTLDFLRRPSLGGWVGLLRTLSTADTGAVSLPWTKAISEWYLHTADDRSTPAFAILDDLGSIEFARKSKHQRAELMNALVTYRNKSVGHGAHFQRDELERRLPLLEHILTYLIGSADFLARMSLLYTEGIAVSDGGRWKTEGLELRGINEEPVSFVLSSQLVFHELYVRAAGSDMEQTPFVTIGPFALWQMSDQTKKPEVFFFNDVWRTKLEYLSYSSGAYYYHKELHEQFRALLRLEISTVGEEEEYASLSPDARSERAEHHFKMGKHLADQGKLEDAVCQLEHSAMFERRADTFLAIACLQRQLKDPGDAIARTLQNCLDIDPANQEAHDLLAAIENQPVGVSDASDVEPHASALTVWHVLVPKRLRDHTLLVLSLVTCLVVCLVSWAEATLAGTTAFLPSYYLGAAAFLVMTASVITSPRLFARMRLPLSLQLDSMRLDRFNRWYDEQTLSVFGRFVMKASGALDVPATLRGERLYYSGLLFTVLLFSPLLFLAIQSYKLPPSAMLIRALGCIGASAWGYLLSRYAVATTAFVFRFSKLSLKPMLTSLNNDGFRSFGPLLGRTIVAAGFAMVLAGIAAALAVTGELGLDLVVFLIANCLFLVWSVGMPASIYTAGVEAKSKAAHEYSAHVEAAFKGFLEEPGEATLQKYRWLLTEQRVIRAIPAWPLSKTETLVYVLGANLLNWAVTILYVFWRTGAIRLAVHT